MPQIRGVVVSAMVVLGACTSLDDGEELELYESEIMDAKHGRLVAPRAPSASDGGGRTGGDWLINGLNDPSVSGVDPDHALDSSEGLGTDGWLGDGDPAGEDVIRYLVECALDEGQSVTVTTGGDDDDDEVSMTFDGLLGLAPGWETGPCGEDCQQWVSACLLARTNGTGAQVTVFVQGDHPSLGFGNDPTHPHHEATFFGNLFTEPEDVHACRGTPMGSFSAAVQGRTCSLDSGECGFEVYDDCVLDAGCGLATGSGVATSDCQPDPGGSMFHGISAHVAHITGRGRPW